VKIATYNVEWFTHLFDENDALAEDGGWSGRWGVTRAEQIAALGIVFKAMNADGIMVIEGPDSHKDRDGAAALEAFAARFGLRTRFNQTLQMDLNTDALPDDVRWSKPPLEIEVTHTSGTVFRMIGVHAKSKAPHGASNDAEVMQISIANRRKQLAQCIWLRKRVEAHLTAGDHLLVMGDFNDGPGLDEYEKLFGRSGVEIVLGEGKGEQLYDPHARMALSRRIGAAPVTARFKKRPEGTFLSVLLDYIMVSESVRAFAPDWTILHPFDHPECYGDKVLREALLTASDHFPVTLDLSL